MMLQRTLSRVILRTGRQLERLIRAHYRRAVSLVLVVSFTLTMTGVPALVAQARIDDWDKDQNYRPKQNLYQNTRPQYDPFLNFNPTTSFFATRPSVTQLNLIKSTLVAMKLDPALANLIATGLTTGRFSNMSVDQIVQTFVGQKAPQATQAPVPASVQLQPGAALMVNPQFAANPFSLTPAQSDLPGSQFVAAGALTAFPGANPFAKPVAATIKPVTPAAAPKPAAAPVATNQPVAVATVTLPQGTGQPQGAGASNPQQTADMLTALNPLLALFGITPTNPDQTTAAPTAVNLPAGQGYVPQGQTTLWVPTVFFLLSSAQGLTGDSFTQATNALILSQKALLSTDQPLSARIDMATQGVAQAQTMADSLKGTPLYGIAEKILAKTLIAQYQLDQKPDTLAKVQAAAAKSGDAQTILVTAQLIMTSADPNAKQDAQAFAAQAVVQSQTTGTPQQQAQTCIAAAEVYRATGDPEGAKVYITLAGQAVQNGNTVQDLVIATQLNMTAGAQVVNTDTISANIATQVQTVTSQGYFPNAAVGYSMFVPALGATVTKTATGYTVQTQANGLTITMDVSPKAAQPAAVPAGAPYSYYAYLAGGARPSAPAAMQINSIVVSSTDTGQVQQTYQNINGKVTLTSGLMTVSVTGFDGTTGPVSVTAMINLNQPTLLINGNEVYAVTVDPTTKQAVAVKATDQDQALSDLVAQQVKPDFTFDKQGNIQGNAQGITVNASTLKAAGYSDQQIQAILGSSASVQAYQDNGSGAIFIGTPAQIMNGNYTVVGKNQFADQSAVGYVAKYQGSLVNTVTLDDGRVFDGFGGFTAAGDPTVFTMTQTSADGTRKVVAKYVNGQLQGSTVTLIGANVTMRYDASGKMVQFNNVTIAYEKDPQDGSWVMTKDSMAALGAQAGVTMNVSGGFTLQVGSTVQTYSGQGRRINLQEGGSGSGQQKVVEQDVPQNVVLQLARYNKPSVALRYQNIVKQQIAVSEDSDGNITETVTNSDLLGEVTSSTTYAVTPGAAGAPSTFKPISYQREMVVDGQQYLATRTSLDAAWTIKIKTTEAPKGAIDAVEMWTVSEDGHRDKYAGSQATLLIDGVSKTIFKSANSTGPDGWTTTYASTHGDGLAGAQDIYTVNADGTKGDMLGTQATVTINGTSATIFKAAGGSQWTQSADDASVTIVDPTTGKKITAQKITDVTVHSDGSVTLADPVGTQATLSNGTTLFRAAGSSTWTGSAADPNALITDPTTGKKVTAQALSNVTVASDGTVTLGSSIGTQAGLSDGSTLFRAAGSTTWTRSAADPSVLVTDPTTGKKVTAQQLTNATVGSDGKVTYGDAIGTQAGLSDGSTLFRAAGSTTWTRSAADPSVLVTDPTTGKKVTAQALSNVTVGSDGTVTVGDAIGTQAGLSDGSTLFRAAGSTTWTRSATDPSVLVTDPTTGKKVTAQALSNVTVGSDGTVTVGDAIGTQAGLSDGSTLFRAAGSTTWTRSATDPSVLVTDPTTGKKVTAQQLSNATVGSDGTVTVGDAIGTQAGLADGSTLFRAAGSTTWTRSAADPSVLVTDPTTGKKVTAQQLSNVTVGSDGTVTVGDAIGTQAGLSDGSTLFRAAGSTTWTRSAADPSVLVTDPTTGKKVTAQQLSNATVASDGTVTVGTAIGTQAGLSDGSTLFRAAGSTTWTRSAADPSVLITDPTTGKKVTAQQLSNATVGSDGTVTVGTAIGTQAGLSDGSTLFRAAGSTTWTRSAADPSVKIIDPKTGKPVAAQALSNVTVASDGTVTVGDAIGTQAGLSDGSTLFRAAGSTTWTRSAADPSVLITDPTTGKKVTAQQLSNATVGSDGTVTVGTAIGTQAGLSDGSTLFRAAGSTTWTRSAADPSVKIIDPKTGKPVAAQALSNVTVASDGTVTVGDAIGTQAGLSDGSTLFRAAGGTTWTRSAADPSVKIIDPKTGKPVAAQALSNVTVASDGTVTVGDAIGTQAGLSDGSTLFRAAGSTTWTRSAADPSVKIIDPKTGKPVAAQALSNATVASDGTVTVGDAIGTQASLSDGSTLFRAAGSTTWTRSKVDTSVLVTDPTTGKKVTAQALSNVTVASDGTVTIGDAIGTQAGLSDGSTLFRAAGSTTWTRSAADPSVLVIDPATGKKVTAQALSNVTVASDGTVTVGDAIGTQAGLSDGSTLFRAAGSTTWTRSAADPNVTVIDPKTGKKVTAQALSNATVASDGTVTIGTAIGTQASLSDGSTLFRAAGSTTWTRSATDTSVTVIDPATGKKVAAQALSNVTVASDGTVTIGDPIGTQAGLSDGSTLFRAAGSTTWTRSAADPSVNITDPTTGKKVTAQALNNATVASDGTVTIGAAIGTQAGLSDGSTLFRAAGSTTWTRSAADPSVKIIDPKTGKPVTAQALSNATVASDGTVTVGTAIGTQAGLSDGTTLFRAAGSTTWTGSAVDTSVTIIDPTTNQPVTAQKLTNVTVGDDGTVTLGKPIGTQATLSDGSTLFRPAGSTTWTGSAVDTSVTIIDPTTNQPVTAQKLTSATIAADGTVTYGAPIGTQAGLSDGTTLFRAAGGTTWTASSTATGVTILDPTDGNKPVAAQKLTNATVGSDGKVTFGDPIGTQATLSDGSLLFQAAGTSDWKMFKTALRIAGDGTPDGAKYVYAVTISSNGTISYDPVTDLQGTQASTVVNGNVMTIFRQAGTDPKTGKAYGWTVSPGGSTRGDGYADATDVFTVHLTSDGSSATYDPTADLTGTQATTTIDGQKTMIFKGPGATDSWRGVYTLTVFDPQMRYDSRLPSGSKQQIQFTLDAQGKPVWGQYQAEATINGQKLTLFRDSATDDWKQAILQADGSYLLKKLDITAACATSSTAPTALNPKLWTPKALAGPAPILPTSNNTLPWVKNNNQNNGGLQINATYSYSWEDVGYIKTFDTAQYGLQTFFKGMTSDSQWSLQVQFTDQKSGKPAWQIQNLGTQGADGKWSTTVVATKYVDTQMVNGKPTSVEIYEGADGTLTFMWNGNQLGQTQGKWDGNPSHYYNFNTPGMINITVNGTNKLFDASGVERTDWWNGTVNTFVEGWNKVGAVWNTLIHDAGTYFNNVGSFLGAVYGGIPQLFTGQISLGKYLTNVLGTGWNVITSDFQAGLDAISLVANSALFLLNGVVFGWAEAGLKSFANNQLRQWNSPIAPILYGATMFLANNLPIITILIIGALTGGVGWLGIPAAITGSAGATLALVGTVMGQVMMWGSLLSNLDKGLGPGLAMGISGFFIQPFNEALAGLGMLFHWNDTPSLQYTGKGGFFGFEVKFQDYSSLPLANGFQVADAILTLAGGLLGIYFAFQMAKQVVDFIAPAVSFVSFQAVMGLLDLFGGVKLTSDVDVKGQMEQVWLGKGNLFGKIAEVMSLNKGSLAEAESGTTAETAVAHPESPAVTEAALRPIVEKIGDAQAGMDGAGKLTDFLRSAEDMRSGLDQFAKGLNLLSDPAKVTGALEEVGLSATEAGRVMASMGEMSEGLLSQKKNSQGEDTAFSRMAKFIESEGTPYLRSALGEAGEFLAESPIAARSMLENGRTTQLVNEGMLNGGVESEGFVTEMGKSAKAMDTLLNTAKGMETGGTLVGKMLETASDIRDGFALPGQADRPLQQMLSSGAKSEGVMDLITDAVSKAATDSPMRANVMEVAKDSPDVSRALGASVVRALAKNASAEGKMTSLLNDLEGNRAAATGVAEGYVRSMSSAPNEALPAVEKFLSEQFSQDPAGAVKLLDAIPQDSRGPIIDILKGSLGDWNETGLNKLTTALKDLAGKGGERLQFVKDLVQRLNGDVPAEEKTTVGSNGSTEAGGGTGQGAETTEQSNNPTTTKNPAPTTAKPESRQAADLTNSTRKGESPEMPLRDQSSRGTLPSSGQPVMAENALAELGADGKPLPAEIKAADVNGARPEGLKPAPEGMTPKDLADASKQGLTQKMGAKAYNDLQRFVSQAEQNALKSGKSSESSARPEPAKTNTNPYSMRSASVSDWIAGKIGHPIDTLMSITKWASGYGIIEAAVMGGVGRLQELSQTGDLQSAGKRGPLGLMSKLLSKLSIPEVVAGEIGKRRMAEAADPQTMLDRGEALQQELKAWQDKVAQDPAFSGERSTGGGIKLLDDLLQDRNINRGLKQLEQGARLQGQVAQWAQNANRLFSGRVGELLAGSSELDLGQILKTGPVHEALLNALGEKGLNELIAQHETLQGHLDKLADLRAKPAETETEKAVAGAEQGIAGLDAVLAQRKFSQTLEAAQAKLEASGQAETLTTRLVQAAPASLGAPEAVRTAAETLTQVQGQLGKLEEQIRQTQAEPANPRPGTSAGARIQAADDLKALETRRDLLQSQSTKLEGDIDKMTGASWANAVSLLGQQGRVIDSLLQTETKSEQQKNNTLIGNLLDRMAPEQAAATLERIAQGELETGAMLPTRTSELLSQMNSADIRGLNEHLSPEIATALMKQKALDGRQAVQTMETAKAALNAAKANVSEANTEQIGHLAKQAADAKKIADDAVRQTADLMSGRMDEWLGSAPGEGLIAEYPEAAAYEARNNASMREALDLNSQRFVTPAAEAVVQKFLAELRAHPGAGFDEVLRRFNAQDARAKDGNRPVLDSSLVGMKGGETLSRAVLERCTSQDTWEARRDLMTQKDEIVRTTAALAEARASGDQAKVKQLTADLGAAQDAVNTLRDQLKLTAQTESDANLIRTLQNSGIKAEVINQARHLLDLDHQIENLEGRPGEGNFLERTWSKLGGFFQKLTVPGTLTDLRQQRADTVAALVSDPKIMEQLYKAEGVKSRFLDEGKIQSEGFQNLMVDLLTGIRGLKSDASTTEVEAALNKGLDAYNEAMNAAYKGFTDALTLETPKQIKQAMVDVLTREIAKLTDPNDAMAKQLNADLKALQDVSSAADLGGFAERYAPLNDQQMAMIREMIMGFQADPNYRNFTANPTQLTFLVRVLEMHVLNLELHGRSDSLLRKLVGQEVELLAMGGGKSAGVLPLVMAREIYKSLMGSEHAPAMMYVTAVDALVDAILTEPAFKSRYGHDVIKVDDAALKDIRDHGFLPDKIYVTSNEGLKKIDLDLRGDGRSDSQIRSMYRDVASVAWDEFHTAFHTTDTILGSTGVWQKLSPEFRAQMRPVMESLVNTYAKAFSILSDDLNYNDGALRRQMNNPIFREVESEYGSEARNQMALNLDYRIRFGDSAGRTLGESLREAGIDTRDGANGNLLQKMAQAMYEMNGRELVGGVRDGRPWYGTAEGGVGKLNTIKGDSVSSALVLVDIMLRDMQANGEFDPQKFKANDLLSGNAKFEEAVGEALAHVTTERVTMLEAVDFVGTDKIVGYSGTLNGLYRTLEQMGKHINAIEAEPEVRMELVKNGEIHFTIALGDQILALDQTGLHVETGARLQEFVLNRALDQAAKGFSQQIFTHNDNGQLESMAKDLAGKLKLSTQDIITINAETVRARFDEMVADDNPAVKGLAWGDRAIQAAVADLLKSTDPTQVIVVSGMSPSEYSAALESLKDAIHRMPKISDVLTLDTLSPEMRASLLEFSKGKGTLSLKDWMAETGRTDPAMVKGVYDLINVNPALGEKFGWNQTRFIFAPNIGEGLNIFAGVDGLGMEINGAWVKGSPTKVALTDLGFRAMDIVNQAFARANIRDPKTGDYKRMAGDTGLDLDLMRINNITGSEIGRFDDFLKGIESGRIDIHSQTAQNEFFAIFDLAMKSYLNEIDTTKAGEVARTRAGQLPPTTTVDVAKTSPEYMEQMAQRVMQEMPGKLRELQGIGDLQAERAGREPSSVIMQNPTVRDLARVQGFVGHVKGLSAVVNAWYNAKAALKSDGQRITLIQQYAKAWQSPQVTALMDHLDPNPVPANDLAAFRTAAKQQLGADWAAKNQNALPQIYANYQKYGSNWFEAGMQDKFGADWRLFQRIGDVRSPLATFRTLFAIQGQKSQAAAQYNRLQDQVAQVRKYQGLFTSLTANDPVLVPALGSLLTHAQYTNAVNRLESTAQDLRARYGLDPRTQDSERAVSFWRARIVDPIATLAEAVQQRPALATGLAAVGIVALIAVLPHVGLIAGLAAAKVAGFSVLGALAPVAGTVAFGAVSKGITQRQAIPEQVSRISTGVKTEAAANVSLTAALRMGVKKATDEGIDQNTAAVALMPTLLKNRQITLTLGDYAKTYGHMLMLATFLDLFAKAKTVPVDTIALGQEAAAGKRTLVVNKGAIGYLAGDRYFDTLLTGLADTLGRSQQATLNRLVGKLSYLPIFQTDEMKGHAELWVTEFIKNFVTNGEQVKAWSTGATYTPAQSQAVQAAYHAVAGLLGREYTEADLSGKDEAAAQLEQDGGVIIRDEARKLAKALPALAPAEREAMKLGFQERFGVSLEEARELDRKPFGYYLMHGLAKVLPAQGPAATLLKAVKIDVSQLQADPWRVAFNTGMAFAGIGVGLLVFSALGGSVVLLGIGGVIGIGGLLLVSQRDAIAWKTNPTSFVMSKLSSNQFSEAVKRGLFARPEFVAAVNKLRAAPGLASETNRTRAIVQTLKFMVDVMRNDRLLNEDKEKQVREIVDVLRLLQFEVKADFSGTRYGLSGLTVQLTPGTQPLQPFKDNDRFWNVIQQLRGVGVEMQNLAPSRPQKHGPVSSDKSA